ncbi:MAG: Verru_Chthon cassette protein D [Candidatus Methylacidiphilales bacterium]|nr:Verru_Chthon cassette protein D [Candidatus Methylacidiphilales bacterium]
MKLKSTACRSAAFSLMELMIVMALIAALAAIAAPAAHRAMMSYQLNLGTETFAGTLSFARQAATTMNRDVEVRLLTVDASAEMPGVKRVRGIQLFDVGETAIKAIAMPRYLPAGIIMNTNASFSSLASLPDETPSTSDPNLQKYGKNYTFRRFRFRPDGSSNLPMVVPGPVPATFFMSLHLDVPGSDTTLPSNFTTIQIEPSTGAVGVHRP